MIYFLLKQNSCTEKRTHRKCRAWWTHPYNQYPDQETILTSTPEINSCPLPSTVAPKKTAILTSNSIDLHGLIWYFIETESTMWSICVTGFFCSTLCLWDPCKLCAVEPILSLLCSIPLCEYTTFYSTVDGHLGSFALGRFLMLLLWTLVYMPSGKEMDTFLLCVCRTMSWIAGHRLGLCSALIDSAKVFQSGCANLYFHSRVWECSLSALEIFFYSF